MGLYHTAALLFILATGVTSQSQYSSGSGGSFNSPGGRLVGRPGSGGNGDFGGGAGGGSEGGDEGEGGSLEETIPGVPGDDYPIFAEVPETSFLCDGQVDGGYYADPEAECQAFHICANDGNGGLTKYSFLCPNGTMFQQQYFVCEWWFNVDCSLAEQFYSLNEEVAAEREANSPAGVILEGGASSGGKQGGRQGGQGGGRGGAGGRRASSSGSAGSASVSRGSYVDPAGSRGGSIGAENGYAAPPGNYNVRRRNSRDTEIEETDY